MGDLKGRSGGARPLRRLKGQGRRTSAGERTWSTPRSLRAPASAPSAHSWAPQRASCAAAARLSPSCLQGSRVGEASTCGELHFSQNPVRKACQGICRRPGWGFFVQWNAGYSCHLQDDLIVCLLECITCFSSTKIPLILMGTTRCNLSWMVFHE